LTWERKPKHKYTGLSGKQWVTYLCAGEQWVGAGGVGDGEGVLGKGVQDTPGIVEKFEGPVTGVGDGGGDLQVLQSIDVGVGGRGFEC